MAVVPPMPNIKWKSNKEFCAQEVLSGEIARSVEADEYSFGALLGFLLTGNMPQKDFAVDLQDSLPNIYELVYLLYIFSYKCRSLLAFLRTNRLALRFLTCVKHCTMRFYL